MCFLFVYAYDFSLRETSIVVNMELAKIMAETKSEN